jgi:SAM-dependent methyltransferase
MTDVLPFEPRRFETAAPHYLAGRPPYAPQLITRVAELCRLRADDRVLDLGCGPGQLARAFAPIVAEVVGIDPEPEMLRIARAESADFSNISFRQGSSYDLAPELGRFRLVCMGRSFHWMDRHDTLRRLDPLIVEDGAVALFHDRQPEVPDNAWRAAYREVLERFSGQDPMRALHRLPGWVRHEGILIDSAFSRIEEIAVYERREVSAQTLIDRALSMSATSPKKLGARAEEMIARLRAVLPSDGVREMVASVAMLAWRP